MTDAQHGTWSPPGSPHPPGSTISICPVCQHEYEHPPVATVVVPPGVDPTTFEPVREAMLARARIMEADLFAHLRDAHGMQAEDEAIERCREALAGQPAAVPRTTDDYQIHVGIGPQFHSARGPSPNIGYRAYFSTCDISEGGGIAFSTEKADVLADLDLLIERLGEARRRVEELP